MKNTNRRCPRCNSLMRAETDCYTCTGCGTNIWTAFSLRRGGSGPPVNAVVLGRRGRK